MVREISDIKSYEVKLVKILLQLFGTLSMPKFINSKKDRFV